MYLWESIISSFNSARALNKEAQFGQSQNYIFLEDFESINYISEIVMLYLNTLLYMKFSQDKMK